MPTLRFTTKYKKNEKLIMSPEEVMAFYFYGVNIQSKDGSKLDDQTILMYIQSAQSEIEKYFDIKLFWQLITASRDYYKDDYYQGFPNIPTEFPVRESRALIGFINGVKQVEYPEAWLSNRTSSDNTYYRAMHVVPNGATVAGSADVILLGVYSQRGYMGYRTIPNYWTIQYDTGYKYNEIPSDLLNMIGMMAAIPLLAIAGDLILGAGIASQSLSIDGLSRSISSTSSATNSGYGSRIVEYRKSIKETVDRLRMYYKNITFTVL